MTEFQEVYENLQAESAYRSFRDVFKDVKPILGVIHLSGIDNLDRINRAIEEITLPLEIFKKGCNIENDRQFDIEERMNSSTLPC
jgi:hypothetical protein